MLSLWRRHEAALDEVVRDLPEGYVALAFGDTHVVVGPTGAFALADAHGADIGEAAHRAVVVARELRQRLLEALSWAPFVDTLVVADGQVGSRIHRWGPGAPRDELRRLSAEGASVVPRRIVRSVLTAGRRQLSPAEVQRIRHALA